MLQKGEPDDYVIGTGVQHTVQECVDIAFRHVSLDPSDFVRTDPDLIRPAEVDLLLGDASKAKRELGWEPRVTFKALVRLMVDADLASGEG